MAKKRKWMDVYREMMDDPRNSPDSKWEELLSLSKGFHHFREGNRLARGYCPKWEKKFLKKMIETAENAGQWYSVVWTADEDSPEWKMAAEKVIKHAREAGEVLYRWQRLRWLFPENHPHYIEATRMVSAIRKKRRKARKKKK